MIKKYKWKSRILLIKTPSYKDTEYLRTKRIYQKEIKRFHKRTIKLITTLVKKDFSIILIDLDGKKKMTLKTLNVKRLFKILDKSKLSKNLLNKKKLINLSLFSDYNPKTTTFGLGFKDKSKAIYTLKKIKNRNQKYQVNVVSTMLGRAKKHPSQTKEMREAILVFNKWMNNYKKKNKK
tara:strand:- start:2369 stop:2905 length:537 start_codon:yes stop_codon:yes gene_type:complete